MFVIQVPSADGTSKYTVRKVGSEWVCDCKGHVHHSNGESYVCRHIAELGKSLFEFISDAAISAPAKDILHLAK